MAGLDTTRYKKTDPVEHAAFGFPAAQDEPAEQPPAQMLAQPDANVGNLLGPKTRCGIKRVSFIRRNRGSQSFNTIKTTPYPSDAIRMPLGFDPTSDAPRIGWTLTSPNKLENVTSVTFELFFLAGDKRDSRKPIWSLTWNGDAARTNLKKDPYTSTKEKDETGAFITWHGTLDIVAQLAPDTLKAITDSRTVKRLKNPPPPQGQDPYEQVVDANFKPFKGGELVADEGPYQLVMTLTATEDAATANYPKAAWTYFTVDKGLYEDLVQARAEAEYWDYVPRFEKRLAYYLMKHEKAHEGANALISKIRALVNSFDSGVRDESLVRLFGRGPATGAFSGTVKDKKKDIEIAITEGNLREKMGIIYCAMRGGELNKELVNAGNSDTTRVKKRPNHATYSSLVDMPYLKKELAKNVVFNNSVTLFFRSAYQNHFERSREFRDATADPAVLKYTPEYFCAENMQVPMSYRELKAQFGDPTCKGSGHWWNYLAGDRKAWSALTEPQRRYIALAEFSGRFVQFFPGLEWYKVKPDSELAARAKKMRVYIAAGISGSTDFYMHTARYFNCSADELKKVMLACVATMVSINDHSTYEVMAAAAQYGVPFFEKENDQYPTNAEPPYLRGYECYRWLDPVTPDEIEKNVGKLPDYFFSEEHLNELRGHVHNEMANLQDLPEAKIAYRTEWAGGAGSAKPTPEQLKTIWAGIIPPPLAPIPADEPPDPSVIKIMQKTVKVADQRGLRETTRKLTQLNTKLQAWKDAKLQAETIKGKTDANRTPQEKKWLTDNKVTSDPELDTLITNLAKGITQTEAEITRVQKEHDRLTKSETEVTTDLGGAQVGVLVDHVVSGQKATKRSEKLSHFLQALVKIDDWLEVHAGNVDPEVSKLTNLMEDIRDRVEWELREADAIGAPAVLYYPGPTGAIGGRGQALDTLRDEVKKAKFVAVPDSDKARAIAQNKRCLATIFTRTESAFGWTQNAALVWHVALATCVEEFHPGALEGLECTCNGKDYPLTKLLHYAKLIRYKYEMTSEEIDDLVASGLSPNIDVAEIGRVSTLCKQRISQNVGSGSPIQSKAKPERPDQRQLYKMVVDSLEPLGRLHDAELSAINDYSGPAFMRYLAESGFPDDAHLVYGLAMKSGLTKLGPSRGGPVFHGRNANAPTAGTVFHQTFPLSTAMDLFGSFIPESRVGWVITRHSSGGRIDYMSEKPWEAELLFPSGVLFYVKGVHDFSTLDMTITINANVLQFTNVPDFVKPILDDPRLKTGIKQDQWRAWAAAAFSKKIWVELVEL
ncbi:MAG: hypothetical protein SFZ23_13325 [Planctomycetota bacterium]|nr:hypothetical protein [Planctomycetota bacterium]